ncbi:hypothetical protein LTS15_000107 [Exophiala xenobiotica]|nr:hypothetical protein LTS15_000107 [Exophiala xenobiotica]
MDDRGPDVHNFSPTQHRLPTVSGIEALQNASARAKGISTRLSALDSTLLPNELSLATPGIQRGCVTEIFGPPGVGKTTFGLQIAANALHTDHEEFHVLWVNTGSPLIPERLRQLTAGFIYKPPKHNAPSSSPLTEKDIGSMIAEKFTYLEAHTLPRVLTLFMHPTRTLPSPKTGLIVVDDLSNLLLSSFSRNPKPLKAAAPAAIKEKLEKRAAGRRFQIIESLGAAMSKMATLQNMAILVLSNATISLKGGQKATLKPALSSQAWDTAIYTRIMLFRDFPDDDQEAQLSKLETKALRYAEVQRLARKEVYKLPVPFVILTDGLRQLDRPRAKGAEGDDEEEEQEVFVDTSAAEAVQPRPPRVDLPLLPDELSQPSQSKKRKATEIADSEDDDDDDDVVVQSNHSEPKVPAINLRNEQSSLKKEEVEAEEEEEEEEEEEMILDTHETALLRSYRYASIRGSEDAIPVHSSSEDDGEEQEEGDGDQDGDA